jgi:hypothetical protein
MEKFGVLVSTAFKKILTLAGNNIPATWLVISVLGGVLFPEKIILFGFSAVLAIIVLTDNVKKVADFAGKQLGILVSGLVTVMIGGRGLSLALIVNGGVLFVIGFFVGGSEGQSLAAVGTVLIIVGMLLPFNKLISKK